MTRPWPRHVSYEETGHRNHSIRIVAERHGNLDDDKPGPIEAFTITDTGIGFTAANFESFNTVDSLYKANLGGSTDPTRNPSNRLRDFRRRALLDYALSACASFSHDKRATTSTGRGHKTRADLGVFSMSDAEDSTGIHH
ncbi:MAG: hypothetical protein WA624_01190 [Methylocella sp.]